MYRLCKELENNQELHKLCELFVTETIKVNVIQGYFKKNSRFHVPCALKQKNSFDEIKNLVNRTKAKSLLTPTSKEWIERQGYNATEYVVKKLAELVQVLYSKDADNPGEFIEYLIYRMIKNTNKNGYYMSPIVEEHLEDFRKLLLPYVQDEIERLNEEEEYYSLEDIPKRLELYVSAVSEFPFLYGAEVLGDEFSFILWDTDFLMFDDAEYINKFELKE